MQALAGKGAVVTGGSRGIGRAIVERLARDGAVVTFSYLSDSVAADAVVAGVAAAGGKAFAVRCDLAEAEQIVAMYDAAQLNNAQLDIVVNNAAVAEVGPIAQTPDEQYDAVMNVNARGTFQSLREAARRVADGGRIVNVSTMSTVTRTAEVGLYAASKAAVEQFTVAAAFELGARGITVNAIRPGATDTEMLRSAFDEPTLAAMAAMSPLGRLGTPADVADVVAFLAGSDARWVTGQILDASGGR